MDSPDGKNGAESQTVEEIAAVWIKFPLPANERIAYPNPDAISSLLMNPKFAGKGALEQKQNGGMKK